MMGQARKIRSTEYQRKLEERLANIRRFDAYRMRKAFNPTKAAIAEAQRCRWLRRQAE